MDRKKEITAARTEAVKRLVNMYPEDFYALKSAVYAERGIWVKRRLTGEMKRQRDIADAKAFLALNGESE
tara:strand:+ start:847 stop:1056 length:210 start_codon:yes stop_codon:yes gene_type:complete